MKILNISKIGFSRKDYIKNLKLPGKLSPKLAYVCGILAGDGSINIRESKKDYLIKCVGNPKDEKEFYNKIITNLFFDLFNIKLKTKSYDSKTTYGFVIYSKSLVEFLTKVIGLPFGKKYGHLKMPAIFKKDKELTLWFIRGLVDTDSCITFKKRYKKIPYYPVISLASKSKRLIEDVADILKKEGFKVVEIKDYKTYDDRFKKGYSVINRLDLNGVKNFSMWMQTIGFRHPKHVKRIKKHWGGHSEGWI